MDSVLGPALHHGLIAAYDQNEYRFTHSLIRETLLAELTPFDRAKLHARAADAIEAETNARAELAVELATHLQGPGDLVDAKRVVGAVLRAGDEALQALARDDAKRWFRLALAAKPVAERDEQRAEIAFGLAQAIRDQRLEDPGPLALEAFQIYVDQGQIESAVRVAAQPYDPGMGERSAWVADLAERAIPLADENSPLWGWLLCQRGSTAYTHLGDEGAEIARANLGGALEAGRRRGDRALQVRALTFLFRMSEGDATRVAELERSIARLALATSQPIPSLELMLIRLQAESDEGRDALAFELAAPVLELAQRINNPTAYVALKVLARIFEWRGEWEGVDRCIASLTVMGQGERAALHRAVIEFEHGEIGAARRHMERHLTLPIEADRGRNWIQYHSAQLCIQIGFFMVESQTVFLDSYVQDTVNSLRLKSVWAPLDGALWMASALLAVARGDHGGAFEAYAALKKPGPGDVSRHRVLGLTAATIGEATAAAEHFEAAIAAGDAAGRAALAAWARFELAEALPAADERRERSLRESRDLAEPLGMALLLSRIDALEGTKAAAATPARLSARELEVLKLVASGKPNKAIGDELSIADKTVESHIRNIYQKIGASSRAEAATFAVRHGIL